MTLVAFPGCSDFFTENDPTNGYVNYVSQAEASSTNIVRTNASYFTMAVDTTVATATGRGRNSVRLVSKDSFADGVYVLDVDHIPVGCGTWPAFWTTTRSGWPKSVPSSAASSQDVETDATCFPSFPPAPSFLLRLLAIQRWRD